jgi:hypothetical protein
MITSAEALDSARRRDVERVHSALAALVCSMLGASCQRLPVPDRVILISLDTLRADYLNVYGYEKFRTSPSLDSFAEENVLFEACIVVEPFTLTSHMSLLTGLLPQHHQVRDETVLPDGVRTVASALREAGYRTQAFVDGGYMDRHWGFDRGSETRSSSSSSTPTTSTRRSTFPDT